jgi:DNA-binding transcriptional regulator YiaG
MIVLWGGTIGALATLLAGASVAAAMSIKAKKRPQRGRTAGTAQPSLRLKLNLHSRWVWELVDGDRHVINSSEQEFATRRDCELDAKRHGFRPVLKSAIELTKLRQKVGLSQAEFWERVGVTQSGGSRYEQGRLVKKPIRMLLALAYGTETERRRVVQELEKVREHGGENENRR